MLHPLLPYPRLHLRLAKHGLKFQLPRRPTSTVPGRAATACFHRRPPPVVHRLGIRVEALHRHRDRAARHEQLVHDPLAPARRQPRVRVLGWDGIGSIGHLDEQAAVPPRPEPEPCAETQSDASSAR